MNRYSSGEKEMLEETQEILKQKASWLFPNDYPTVSQFVNSGKPLIEMSPKTSIGKSYRDFAYSFDDQPKKAQGTFSVLAWLRPSKSGKTQAAT